MTRPGFLQALGEWSSVHTISEENWDSVSSETRNRMANMATSAAWNMSDWGAMEKYTNLLPREVSKRKSFKNSRNYFWNFFVKIQKLSNRGLRKS